MTRSLKAMIRLFAGGLMAISLSLVILMLIGKSPQPIVNEVLRLLPIEMVSWSGSRSARPAVGPWPPVAGQRYPDLELRDQHGDTVHLSDFAGKVILLELAAVPCKGCQAFAGGNKVGGFAGVPVQPGLSSIGDYAEQFARVKLGEDENVVFVQLLLYGQSMTSPTQQEVTAWARHFGMNRQDNEIVLQGDPSMLGRASYQMIPGFHLIDRDFILRYDSSGHQSACDLYRDLLPALGEMCR